MTDDISSASSSKDAVEPDNYCFALFAYWNKAVCTFQPKEADAMMLDVLYNEITTVSQLMRRAPSVTVCALQPQSVDVVEKYGLTWDLGPFPSSIVEDTFQAQQASCLTPLISLY